MLVKDPPYDLIALVADLDIQRLFGQIIERAQEPGRSCIRPIRWRLVEVPMRDATSGSPADLLEPYKRSTPRPRILLIWDRNDSGSTSGAGELAEVAVDQLARRGWAREEIHACVLGPELEIVFGAGLGPSHRAPQPSSANPIPVESRILEFYRKRQKAGASQLPFEQLGTHEPEEVFQALVDACGCAGPLRSTTIWERGCPARLEEHFCRPRSWLFSWRSGSRLRGPAKPPPAS